MPGGVTPIEKNIRVVDEQGREYAPTYPRRAKGLIKHGRARLIGENTICLTCPPVSLWEDKHMDEQNEMLQSGKTAASKLSIEDILSQTDRIIKSDAHIHEALELLKSVGDSVPGGDGTGGEKAEAIAEVVEAREQTNREIIAFLRKVYDDLTSDRKDKVVDSMERFARLKELAAEIGEYDEDEAVAMLKNAANSLLQ